MNGFGGCEGFNLLCTAKERRVVVQVRSSLGGRQGRVAYRGTAFQNTSPLIGSEISTYAKLYGYLEDERVWIRHDFLEVLHGQEHLWLWLNQVVQQAAESVVCIQAHSRQLLDMVRVFEHSYRFSPVKGIYFRRRNSLQRRVSERGTC